MTKITFVNNTSPALSAENLNQMQTNVENEFDNMIPIGCGIDYYGVSLPSSNFMWADGSAISRTTYSKLYSILGTRYGSGNGSTTFNLPDKRERVTVMYKSGSSNGTSGATLGTMGAKGGEFTHTQTIAEMATHRHDNILVTGQTLSLNSDGSNALKLETASGMASASNNNIYTSSKGSSSPMNNMQPYLVCNYIIRVK